VVNQQEEVKIMNKTNKTKITNPGYAKTRLPSQRGGFVIKPESPDPIRPEPPPKSKQMKPAPSASAAVGPWKPSLAPPLGARRKREEAAGRPVKPDAGETLGKRFREAENGLYAGVKAQEAAKAKAKAKARMLRREMEVSYHKVRPEKGLPEDPEAIKGRAAEVMAEMKGIKP
jgi:hypothetical protein